ncbi:hypothetical protein D3C86_1214980 [compost metagenome]
MNVDDAIGICNRSTWLAHVVQRLTFHFLGRGLSTAFGERKAQGLRRGALRDLTARALRPHGVRCNRLVLAALGGVVLDPVLGRRELGDGAVEHQLLDRDARPLGERDFHAADLLRDHGPELGFGLAGEVASACRLGAIQADARHHDVAHLLGLAVPHRNDMHGLLHWVEAGRLAVAENHLHGLAIRSWVEGGRENVDEFVVRKSEGAALLGCDCVHGVPFSGRG